MASRWIRWNLTTHIWEYSTDNGSNWAPLPLNATILNEGTIDPARLPATVPVTGGNNTWTGTNIISSTVPTLIFNETDQGANLKRIGIVVDTGSFTIQAQNDAGAGTANLFVIGRDGKITSSSTGTPHTFTMNRAGSSIFTLSNPDAGATSSMDFAIATNIGTVALLRGFSSNFVNYFAVQSMVAGGLVLNAANGGPVDIYSGGARRFTVDAAGNVIVQTGFLHATQGIVEFGRTNALGHWVAIAHNPAYFNAAAGVFTVDPGDLITYKYTTIGKTCFVHVAIATASLSLATPTISIQLPFQCLGSISFQSTIYRGDVGWLTGYSTITNFDNKVVIYGNAGAGAWAALANTVYVNFDIAYQIS